jgi:hypothetical protein
MRESDYTDRPNDIVKLVSRHSSLEGTYIDVFGTGGIPPKTGLFPDSVFQTALLQIEFIKLKFGHSLLA